MRPRACPTSWRRPPGRNETEGRAGSPRSIIRNRSCSFLAHRNGNVGAERLFGHIIAIHGVGTGPATATDVDELALAALAFILFEVAQIVEDLGVVPEILELDLLDVAN